eukprot:17167-Heterococcus_DN1.PRE.4
METTTPSATGSCAEILTMLMSLHSSPLVPTSTVKHSSIVIIICVHSSTVEEAQEACSCQP